MRIVIAPDKFKECLSARMVAEALGQGVKKVCPDAEVILIPMADGGEGTLSVLVDATFGNYVTAPSHDALNRPMDCRYGILGDGETAVIELASASGLQHLKPHERNPLFTTTFGTGELIRHAVSHGLRKFIIGLGGSATQDGGAGLLQALGMRFLSADGRDAGFGANALRQIQRVSMDEWMPELRSCHFTIACDVTSPLCGPQGSAGTFAIQKGATPDMIPILDGALKHFAQVLSNYFGVDWSTTPGAGAAGGTAFSLLSCTRAKIVPGVELIARYTCLEEMIQRADWVFTGEGRIDRQTLSGKVPCGVIRLAAKHQVPVAAFCGQMGEGAELLYAEGVRAIFPVSDPGISLNDSISMAPELLTKAAEHFMHIIRPKAS